MTRRNSRWKQSRSTYQSRDSRHWGRTGGWWRDQRGVAHFRSPSAASPSRTASEAARTSNPDHLLAVSLNRLDQRGFSRYRPTAHRDGRLAGRGVTMPGSAFGSITSRSASAIARAARSVKRSASDPRRRSGRRAPALARPCRDRLRAAGPRRGPLSPARGRLGGGPSSTERREAARRWARPGKAARTSCCRRPSRAATRPAPRAVRASMSPRSRLARIGAVPPSADGRHHLAAVDHRRGDEVRDRYSRSTTLPPARLAQARAAQGSGLGRRARPGWRRRPGPRRYRRARPLRRRWIRRSTTAGEPSNSRALISAASPAPTITTRFAAEREVGREGVHRLGFYRCAARRAGTDRSAATVRCVNMTNPR